MIYNLRIVFKEDSDVIEHLCEEMYAESNEQTLLEEALSSPDFAVDYPDAPPELLKEIVEEYYHSLFDEFSIVGVA